MSWFVTPFTDNQFMVRALEAGVLVALLCAIAGTFVVLRGLAFIGDALAHGVLPGVAGALLLGAPGIVGATIGSAVMIVGVDVVTKKTRLSSDTAIGLLFVGMLALGVMIVSRSDSFNGDIVRILFGEILGIDTNDIWMLVGATIVIAVLVAMLYRPFLLLCFDPEQADVAGFPSARYHLVMLIMVAVTVIVSFQAVGTLLVFGMLIAPAGAGALMARKIAAMMAWAGALGALSVYVGLLLSYHYDLAAGATIVFVAVSEFFLVLAIQGLRQARTQGALVWSALLATGLSVGYDQQAVVSDITVSIEPGQALALVGTNGSGKSTFLKTIVGLQASVSGDLTVLGGEPGSQPARVAYLGQAHSSRFVLPLQAIDVVRMGRFASLGLRRRATARDRNLVDEAMEAMGITQLSGRPVRTLSGGQQQRVYLAQVLAHEADLLVLDEPTAGLDVAGRDYFRRAVEMARSRGAAVVTATHDIGEANDCERVMLVARRVIAQGSPAEVLTAEHLLATFGVVLHGLEHLDHRDLVLTEEPHGHDHDHGHH